jgi:glycosyltransferase involved in cell wall biosynthesis
MNKRVVIAAGTYPPEAGGVSTVSARVASELSSQGVEVVVVTYRDAASPIEQIGSTRLVSVSRAGNVVVRYLRYLRALARETQTDSVVLVTDSLSTGLPVRLLSLVRRLKIVIRLGGERSWENAIQSGSVTCSLRDYWLGKGMRSHRLMRWYYRWFFGMAREVVLVSSLLKRCFEKMVSGSTARFQVIPNRVAPSRAMSVVDHEARPHTPLRLLFVGRMYRVKNVPFLAYVIKQCVKQGLSIEATFIGGGDQEEEAKRILADVAGVSFLGECTAAQVRAAFDETDLLLLPSITDIYPNVVIESLLQGVPVLLTSEHGLEAGFGGILTTSPTEEEAWVERIRSLLDTQTYETLRSSIRIPEYQGPTLVEILTRM